MTKWHAHVVHMAKYVNMVGGPSLAGGPGTFAPPPKSGAAYWVAVRYKHTPKGYFVIFK